MKKLIYILLFVGFIAGSTAAPQAPFHKGVNFSRWFQESSVDLVGFTKYTKQDILNVKGMGADAIRLPINFYAMTSGSPDYTVSPLLFTMLDTVVAWAEEEEMYLILDNHSYDPSFNAHPDLKNILSKMWIQIADHYKGRSQYLLYEIINEPSGFSDAVWADMMQTVVTNIRTKDKVHTIVVSPLEWSGYLKLDALPVFADKNLLYTVHIYAPFIFTHQGAGWVGLESISKLPFPYGASPMPAVPAKNVGTWVEADMNSYNYGGTVQRIKDQIGVAVKFAQTRNVPLWCGEFGVYSLNAIPEQRVFWYDTVSKILESQGIAWTIWDYHFEFGIFNTTEWGSFEHDVNIPLVEALGFTAPAQTPYVKRPETSSMIIYDDYLASGIHNVSLPSGQVNMFNEKQPAKGRYAISLTNFKMPDALSFKFVKDKDLSQLKAEGYALEFQLRTGYAGKFAVRFLDTKTSVTDRPWRAEATVNTVSHPKEWQTVSIPLTDFKDAGSWDGKWYVPEGKFDWTAIERLEISAAFANFGDSVLYFDQIRIRIPGSPESVVVVPIAPIVPKPVVVPPTEVVVVPAPAVVPPKEVVIVPEPVVVPPKEVVVVPAPAVVPPKEVVVVPEPVVIPPKEVVVVPVPAVVPPKEVVVVPEPVVVPPTEVVVVPAPAVVPPKEVVVVPEPAVIPPKEVVVVPTPVVVPPKEVVVVPVPAVIPPKEVVVVPTPVVVPPKEAVVVPKPVVKPPKKGDITPKPVVVPPAEVVGGSKKPDKIKDNEVIAKPSDVVVVPKTDEKKPTELIITPKTIHEVPIVVVIPLQPVAEEPDEVTVAPEPAVKDVVGTDQPKGTGEFIPVVGDTTTTAKAQDTIRVGVTIVDVPDSSLEKDAGSIKQLTETSQSEKLTEPYYFRLDKGWLIIESQQPVVSVIILDASLRLVKKEEGTNKILVEYLPKGNYFVKVKFADGLEIMKPGIIIRLPLRLCGAPLSCP